MARVGQHAVIKRSPASSQKSSFFFFCRHLLPFCLSQLHELCTSSKSAHNNFWATLGLFSRKWMLLLEEPIIVVTNNRLKLHEDLLKFRFPTFSIRLTSADCACAKRKSYFSYRVESCRLLTMLFDGRLLVATLRRVRNLLQQIRKNKPFVLAKRKLLI